MTRKRKTETVYKGKTKQLTVYVTPEAKVMLLAARRRGAGKGRKVPASDVVTFCILQAADLFDLQTATLAANTGT